MIYSTLGLPAALQDVHEQLRDAADAGEEHAGYTNKQTTKHQLIYRTRTMHNKTNEMLGKKMQDLSIHLKPYTQSHITKQHSNTDIL